MESEPWRSQINSALLGLNITISIELIQELAFLLKRKRRPRLQQSDDCYGNISRGVAPCRILVHFCLEMEILVEGTLRQRSRTFRGAACGE